MYFKFLLACLLLAGLLVFGGAWLVRIKSQFQDRGNFLVKHLKRYDFYQEKAGRNLTGVTELIAADDSLRRALAKTTTDPSTEELSSIARVLHERVASPNSIQPDVMIVFDARGRQLWAPKGSPIEPKLLLGIAAVEKARAGNLFQHRIQIVDKVAFQMSALPVRATEGEQVIGGVLLGVRLQRLVSEYTDQTDDDPLLRYRPVLLDGSVLYASALPGDAADVARAMQQDKLVKVTLGKDTREVIRLKDHDYDFYAEDLQGYRNNDPGSVGKLYIARSRAKVFDPASSLPWIEIGIGIGLSLAISFLMGLWVVRPIKRMLKQSKEMLAGETDLTQRIVVNSRDETADLAENINQVFARVHSLAVDVQATAFQVGASSAQISAAARTMLGGVKDQQIKVESSSTAVTELSASIQQVAANTARGTTVAEQSSTAVNAAVRRMEQIRVAVDVAASKMRELGGSSQRIGNIVEVIRQISEQTSMLALNASIEAAHAGEQGRGFAVVADEVSSLARRVGQSAKDIEALIETVKEQTRSAIASMEVGTREVVSGSELVESTLGGLTELIAVVKDTATTTHEQAVVSDEIARNMDVVRSIATEMLSGSEQSVVQADRLHELAFTLEESVASFNLEHARVKSPPRATVPRRPRSLPSAQDKPAVDS